MAASRESSTDEPASGSRADETERLIAELRARGIDFLTGGRDDALAAAVAAHPLAPTDLLYRLASCPEPSVRDATIALLLLHPELAAYLPLTLPSSTGANAQQVAALALAATYLRRGWQARLALALGTKPPLSVEYWCEWRLPDPDSDPEYGLRMLAVRERERTGRPVNYLAMWQQQVDHLTSQAWRAHRRAQRPSDERQSMEDGNPHITSAVMLASFQPRSSEGAMGMPHEEEQP
jgi:hypothetical protein